MDPRLPDQYWWTGKVCQINTETRKQIYYSSKISYSTQTTVWERPAESLDGVKGRVGWGFKEDKVLQLLSCNGAAENEQVCSFPCASLARAAVTQTGKHTTSRCRTACHRSAAARPWSSWMSERTSRKTSATAGGSGPGAQRETRPTRIKSGRREKGTRKQGFYSQLIWGASRSSWTDPCPTREQLSRFKQTKTSPHLQVLLSLTSNGFMELLMMGTIHWKDMTRNYLGGWADHFERNKDRSSVRSYLLCESH